jgi:hypothetical protein
MTQKPAVFKLSPFPGCLARAACPSSPANAMRCETQTTSMRRLSRVLVIALLGLSAGCATQVIEEPKTCEAWSLVTHSPILLFERPSSGRGNP